MRLTLYFDDSENDFNADRYIECFVCFDNIDLIPEEMKNNPMLSNLWENDTWIRILKRDMHEWLNSYGVTYSLHFTCIQDEYENDKAYLWEIDVPENIAILFKLTWC